MEKGSITLIISGQEVVSKAQMADVQRQTSTVTVLDIESKATAAMPIAPEPEIDYSVTHNGDTYTRLAYENEETRAEGEIQGDSLYLVFSLRGIQFARFDSYSTNLGTGNDTQYIALEFDTDAQYIESVDGQRNECVSFYAVSADGDNLYFEIFAKAGEPTKTNIYNYTGSEWDNDQSEIENLGPYTLARIKITNYENTPVCTLGDIPQYQPTK